MGRFQLQGALNFPLLARADIGVDSFGGSLHGFGRYIEAGQQFELRDGTAAKITQLSETRQNGAPLVFKRCQRL